MLKLKPSVFVSAMAFAYFSLNATVHHQHTPNLLKVKKGSAFHQAPVRNKNIVKKATVSGVKNQFDADLARATFIWRDAEHKKPDLSLVKPENKAKVASDFYLRRLIGSSSRSSGINTKLKYISEKAFGPIVAKYKQTIQGVEVFNKEYNILMDRGYNLVAGSGYLSPELSVSRARSLVKKFDSATPEQAIQVALSQLSQKQLKVALTRAKVSGQYQVFDAQSQDEDYVIIGQPRVKRVFYEHKHQPTAAYYVEVQLGKTDSVDSHYYNYVIHAETSEILFSQDLSAHFSDYTYRAYAKPSGHPMQGPHGRVLPKIDLGQADKSKIEPAPLISLSHYSTLSTQDPWLPDDATSTIGNNVIAYSDAFAPDGLSYGDILPTTTSDKTFDYPLDPEQPHNSVHNRKAAALNMFYMNNFMHDFYYDYGFDELAGNAQKDNYQRGGLGDDPLRAEAQDYSGMGNANMMTPADGASPRMQQYLYPPRNRVNGEDYYLRVATHPDIDILQSTLLSKLGPTQFNISATSLQRAYDDPESTSIFDACDPLTNDEDNNSLVDKVAIIDRGNCSFTTKIRHAEEAGAIAAIVVNNIDDGLGLIMSGSRSLSIPSISISYQEGHRLYELMENEDVQVEMFSKFQLKDSSFDNGVIAHEWGHYIQHRLIGNSSGLNSAQSRSLGEGWSDVHSLIFLVNESHRNLAGNAEFKVPYATASYVSNFATGIRRVPYTPDLTINPLMFEHIKVGAQPAEHIPATRLGRGGMVSVHDAGEIWASTLWDFYVHLLNTYDFAEAEKRFVTYLVNGYKMTPLTPTFLEARDAILAVVYATDKADYDSAIKVFARRGMGLDAVGPYRDSKFLIGVRNGFATEASSYSLTDVKFNPNFDGEEKGYCSLDGVLDLGETATVSAQIINNGQTDLSGVQVKFVVTSDHKVTFANEGIVTLPDMSPYQTVSTGEVTMTLDEAGTAEKLKVEIQFPELNTDDAIIEPERFKFSTQVNMAYAPKTNESSKLTNDMQSPTLFADFKQRVLMGGEDAKNTQIHAKAFLNLYLSEYHGIEYEEDPEQMYMWLRNNYFDSDVVVETGDIQVGFGANFILSFWHFYDFERKYDGGVIEISVNGGDWFDIEALDPKVKYGYDRPLEQHAFRGPAGHLVGRDAYTGHNIWEVDEDSYRIGNTEVINFGQQLQGQSIRLRFRVTSDQDESYLGWFIDDVVITNAVNDGFHQIVSGQTEECDNALPKLTVLPYEAVLETDKGKIETQVTDRNQDVISYSWQQVSGPLATIEDATSSTLVFTPPIIDKDVELAFEITVSDGTEEVSDIITVMVTNIDEVVTIPKVDKDKGSALSWFTLLLLPILGWRRRVKR